MSDKAKMRGKLELFVVITEESGFRCEAMMTNGEGKSPSLEDSMVMLAVALGRLSILTDSTANSSGIERDDLWNKLIELATRIEKAGTQSFRYRTP